MLKDALPKRNSPLLVQNDSVMRSLELRRVLVGNAYLAETTLRLYGFPLDGMDFEKFAAARFNMAIDSRFRLFSP